MGFDNATNVEMETMVNTDLVKNVLANDVANDVANETHASLDLSSTGTNIEHKAMAMTTTRFSGPYDYGINASIHTNTGKTTGTTTGTNTNASVMRNISQETTTINNLKSKETSPNSR